MIPGVSRGGLRPADIEILAGQARELMEDASAAMAVSGSVSLELLSARVPTVIVYRISRLAFVVQSWFRHARFITLVNLMAVREPIGAVSPVAVPPATVAPADPEAIYPEYLTVADPADQVADHVIEWHCDAAARQRVIARLDEVAARVAEPGSAAKAAAAVVAIAVGADPGAAVLGVERESRRQAAARAA
jgi:lipid A disaccharide synthetase